MKKKLNELKGRKFLSAFCLRKKISLRHFLFYRRLRKKEQKQHQRIARLRKCSQLRLQNSILRNESLLSLYTRSIRYRTIFTTIAIFGAFLIAVPVTATGLPASTLDMFNENDIPYYDPCAGSSGGSSGGSSTSYNGDITVCGSTAEEKIWTGLVSMFESLGSSYPKEQTGGLMGNSMAEASLNPVIHEATKRGITNSICDAHLGGFSCLSCNYGFGLWQWSYDENRLPVLQAITDDCTNDFTEIVNDWQTYGTTDGNGLLGIIGDDDFNEIVAREIDYLRTQIQDAFSGILEQTTVENASSWWSANFEKCGNCASGPTLEKRANFGQGFYDSLKDFQCSGSSSSSSNSNSKNNSSNSDSDNSNTTDGSDVLVIGDSITERSKSEIKKLLPKAKIDSKSGRTFQEGLNILKSESNPRDTIVFALGSNESNVQKKDAEEVISLAGDDRKVIFVTNYSLGKIDYTHNNELFKKLAEDHDNVSIADWASAVSSDSTKYIAQDPDGVDVHPTVGDGTKLFAQTIYNTITNSASRGDDECESGSGSASGIDEDGWASGLEGFVKEDAEEWAKSQGVSLKDHSSGAYATSDGKPSMIVLHYTVGQTIGMAAYGENLYPAHFTIDLKKKQAYQHFSLDEPSTAVGSVSGGPVWDSYAIQFEIVGDGYDGWAGAAKGGPYDLKNFTDEEWDYLAKYLVAVSEYTGVPLESSLDWSSPNNKMSREEALAFHGVLGHMHLPDQDGKSDPGNIWDQVKAAIDRAGGGNFCTVSETDVCGNVTSTTTQAKSGSTNALQEYAKKYVGSAGTPTEDYRAAIAAHQAAGKYVGGNASPGEDCGGFVTILLQDSGWDSNYNSGNGNTTFQLQYVQNPSNGWHKLNTTDVSQLQPGDVAFCGDSGNAGNHTFIYTGMVDGNGPFAYASLDSVWPTWASSTTGQCLSGVTVYYRKGGQ